MRAADLDRDRPGLGVRPRRQRGDRARPATLTPGGWSTYLSRGRARRGQAHGSSWYTGFDRPNTMFAGLIGGAFLSMASHGADQLIVQRLLSAKSLRGAQAAVIGSGVVVILQFTLFLMLGIGLWGFFGGRAFPIPDSIFPTFIVDHMPHGLVGLLLAAVLAATMSTHSGAINSLAAAATHDIYLPLTALTPTIRERPRTRTHLSALAWGIVLTAARRCFCRTQRRWLVPRGFRPRVRLTCMGAITLGVLSGVIFRRSGHLQRDAIIGMSVGIIAMSLIVFAKQISAAIPSWADALRPVSTIAYPWYVLIGTTITLSVGILSSLTHGLPAAVPPRVDTI